MDLLSTESFVRSTVFVHLLIHFRAIQFTLYNHRILQEVYQLNYEMTVRL